MANGANQLSDAKLLAIVLTTGRRNESAESLALTLINTFGGLTGLYQASVEQLMSVPGIGVAKAAQIKAALELGKRTLAQETSNRMRIRTPEEAVDYAMQYFEPLMSLESQEHFVILLLDAKHQPIKHVELSRGDATQTVVSPKDVIREASLVSASAVIMIHNHPSGDPTPSTEDIAVTKSVGDACALVGTRLLDHIIIGRSRHVSLARENLI